MYKTKNTRELKILILLILYFITLNITYTQTLYGTKTSGAFHSDNSGYQVDLSKDGNRMIIGTHKGNLIVDNITTEIDAGYIEVYEYDGSDWILLGSRIYGESSWDIFGWSVSINDTGNRIAVGIPQEDTNGFQAGQVKIYDYVNNNWILSQTINDSSAGDQFGYSVAFDETGDKLVIGAPQYDTNNDNNTGLIKVYEYDNNTSSYIQLGQDIIGNDDSMLGLVCNLTPSGDTLFAYRDDPNSSPDIYRYTFDGINWSSSQSVATDMIDLSSGFKQNSLTTDYSGSTIAYVDINNEIKIVNCDGTGCTNNIQTISSLSGTDISLSLNHGGDRLAIGIEDADNSTELESGSLMIYDLDGGSWTQTGNTIYGDSAGDHFGASIAINDRGNKILTGAPLDFVDNIGSVYAYQVLNVFSNSNTGSIRDTRIWSNTNNWSLNKIPNYKDDIQISENSLCILDTNFTINNLEIEEFSLVLLEENYSLNIKENLTIDPNSFFSMTSNNLSSSSLIVDGESTGNLTYERHVTTNWHAVSSPLLGETIEDLLSRTDFADGSNGNLGLAFYNNSYSGQSGWEYITNSSSGPLTSGQGFITKKKTEGLISFTGILITVDLNHVITDGTQNAWNLIGNPYPSFLAANNSAGSINFLSTNINQLNPSYAALYYWNTETSSYEVINHVSSANYISPGQAFFVHAKSGGGTISFTKSMQSHQSGDHFYRSNRQNIPEIELNLSSENESNATLIKFIEGTTTGLDVGYDAGNQNSNDISFDISTHLVTDSEGIDFMLQCLPPDNYDNLVIPLSVTASAGKEITFSAIKLHLDNIPLFLEDKQTNIITSLDSDSADYSVYLDQSENGIGRFYLHTSSNTLHSNNSDIEFDSVNLSVNESNELYVDGLNNESYNISVFNILGKKVLSVQVPPTNQKFKKDLNWLKSGIYLVNLKGTNYQKTIKIVIR